MFNISPTVAKLVAAGLALAALVATAFVDDPAVQLSLVGIAATLTGKEFLRRTGDVSRDAHADDL